MSQKQFRDDLTHKLGYGHPCRSTLTRTMIPKSWSLTLESKEVTDILLNSLSTRIYIITYNIM